MTKTRLPLRIAGLDLLRSLAILAVLVSHGRHFVTPYIAELEHLRLFGFFGVELFFVLSGFLIGSILLRGVEGFDQRKNLTAFLLRRWLRTLPNYYLFLAINGLVALVLGQAIPHFFAYLFFLQNIADRHPAFFGEAWSLAVEEWFYLCFSVSLCLALMLKRSLSMFLILVLIFMTVPTILRVWWVTMFDPSWDEGVRKIVVLRLDAVMFGVAFALVKKYFPGFWRRRQLDALILGVVILTGCGTFFAVTDLDHSWFARTFLFTLTSVGFSALIPFCDNASNFRRRIVTVVVQNIAAWSYSMYLTNLLAFTLVMRVLGDRHGKVFLLDGVGLLCFALICMLSSALIYRYFEYPILCFRDEFSKRQFATRYASARYNQPTA